MLSCIMKTRDARDKALTAAKLLFYKMKHWWRHVYSFRNIITKKFQFCHALKIQNGYSCQLSYEFFIVLIQTATNELKLWNPEV